MAEPATPAGFPTPSGPAGPATPAGAATPAGPATSDRRAAPLSGDEAGDLLRVAHAAAQLAYSPYSGVRIGAALLAQGGEVFAGCNVENASYGLSQCAERVALAKAVSAGERRFRAIAVASSRPQPPLPCGACRQVLREFAADLVVVCQGAEGPPLEAWLAELLPRPFTGRDVV
jgi:cytidine deaminase